MSRTYGLITAAMPSMLSVSGKIRWAAKGKGKSGGVRVIYSHVTTAHQIRMILIYRKGIMDTLTDKQKAQLRGLNKGWK